MFTTKSLCLSICPIHEGILFFKIDCFLGYDKCIQWRRQGSWPMPRCRDANHIEWWNCYGFCRTGHYYIDGRQYSGFLLWYTHVTSLKIVRGPFIESQWSPGLAVYGTESLNTENRNCHHGQQESSSKEGEGWLEPVLNIHTSLSPTVAPFFYLSLLNSVS